MKKITTIITFLFVILLQAQNFTGTWNTPFGDVRLIHEDQFVYGDYSSIGIIDAIQTGYTINGKFTNNGKVGEFYFKLASDNKSFTGEWKWQGDTKNQGNWTGTLKSDSYPSLKMDKWTGQYEFNAYPGVFTKKLNLQQKGLRLVGKFDDGKSFFGKLDNDLKTVAYGSFYHENTQYSLYKSYIKTENSENITAWYGQIGKLNTNEKVKFYAKFLKPMTVAEFTSLTGGNSTSATNYTKATGGLTTVSQELSNSSSSIKTKKDYEGRYRVTLTHIKADIDTFFYDLDNPLTWNVDIFGTAGIRMYGKSTSSNVEIKAIGNKKPRLWDISSSDPVKLKQNSGLNNTDSSNENSESIYELIKVSDSNMYYNIDRIIEFDIKGDLANENLEVNVQMDVTQKLTGRPDYKFGWKQRSIKIKDIEFGKQYYLVNKKDKDNWIAIGFKIEKN